MGRTQKVGSLGEELVVRFLMKRGFTILDRNYRRPWGELDIVAERKNKIHFVEVKAMSQRIVSDETKSNVSSETSEREAALAYIRSKVKKDRFSPEDHVNKEKIKRQGRIIQTYLGAKHVSGETNWQFDVASVLIDSETKKAKINLLEDLIL
ncbi:MAG: YraN family protein [bacterium]|nr:YraN family protein [bacterium]